MTSPSECEARAAAGEKPVVEWTGTEIDWSEMQHGIYAVEKFVSGWGVRTIRRPKRLVEGLSSMTAAQLYAESLLREATAPLHDDSVTLGLLAQAESFARECNNSLAMEQKNLAQADARISALEARIAQLEAENAALKEHATLLDGNWSTLHNAGMDTIRTALGMPTATVPEMVDAIAALRAAQKWTPASEPPEHSNWVLATIDFTPARMTDSHVKVSWAMYGNGKWHVKSQKQYPIKVYAWMEPPSPSPSENTGPIMLVLENDRAMRRACEDAAFVAWENYAHFEFGGTPCDPTRQSFRRSLRAHIDAAVARLTPAPHSPAEVEI